MGERMTLLKIQGVLYGAVALGIAAMVALAFQQGSFDREAANAARLESDAAYAKAQAADVAKAEEAEAARKADAERRAELVEDIAGGLAKMEYMQPPFVEASAKAGLAREAASLIVSGRCSRADFEQWGWAKASLGGNSGDYFTYCESGGKPQIVYVSPN